MALDKIIYSVFIYAVPGSEMGDARVYNLGDLQASAKCEPI